MKTVLLALLFSLPAFATEVVQWENIPLPVTLHVGHLTLVFNGDLNPCHVGAVHLSGPVPKLHDLHGNLVIEEGRP